jgi:predicted O-linked N-acetylglucosamine transferase (SPINDLY family)
MRGRITAGCYRQIGFEECVAQTAEEYVEKAVRLANDRDYRAWVSSEIRERCDALYEDKGIVAQLADHLEAAFRRACA